MDHRAVIFEKDGSVKILHGINPADYKGRRDVLIDPKIPRAVPPHLWVLKDGIIEGSGEVLQKPNRRFKPELVYFTAGFFIGGLVVSSFHFFR